MLIQGLNRSRLMLSPARYFKSKEVYDTAGDKYDYSDEPSISEQLGKIPRHYLLTRSPFDYPTVDQMYSYAYKLDDEYDKFISPSRHYVVRDTPERSYRTSEQNYSYSYNSNVDSSSNRYGDPYGPTNRSYSSNESVTRSNIGGPGGYSYSTERSSRSRGDGVPGGYSSSYSSTSSGRLPGGTTYRHYSYRV
ncbi:unnamed protein product [Acanthoscelides obtectus]|uniref:Uncharacterized protein n=1 Tax=Acanthoscelides obtectus TaxID=200917 RepID=A0A9P0KHV5_ACAOB|nr:unnamed protein product [Acanthoscelides obtectus]CAK1681661.1 Protein anoxia up-regulated [Acanthoscelides obtectus]